MEETRLEITKGSERRAIRGEIRKGILEDFKARNTKDS